MRELTIKEKAVMFDRIIERYSEVFSNVESYRGREKAEEWHFDNVCLMGGQSNFTGDLIEYVAKNLYQPSSDNELVAYEQKLRQTTDSSMDAIKERNTRLQRKINHFSEYMLEDCDNAFMVGASTAE